MYQQILSHTAATRAGALRKHGEALRALRTFDALHDTRSHWTGQAVTSEGLFVADDIAKRRRELVQSLDWASDKADAARASALPCPDFPGS